MAQLSRILGSILKDMVAAQHEANMYAIKLSAAYRNRNQAVSFDSPGACLGEVELMLHCGFTGETVKGEMYEIDQTTVLRVIGTLSSEIAESMVTCILSEIIAHSAEHRDGEGPIARLNREKAMRSNFASFLERRLYSYMKGHRDEFINLDGSIDIERLRESVMFVAEDRILSHSDLEDVFAGDASGQLLKSIMEKLGMHVNMILPRILKDVQVGKLNDYDSLDVEVSAVELAKLPEECIQTFRLKIFPRDIQTEPETGQFNE